LRITRNITTNLSTLFLLISPYLHYKKIPSEDELKTKHQARLVPIIEEVMETLEQQIIEIILKNAKDL